MYIHVGMLHFECIDCPTMQVRVSVTVDDELNLVENQLTKSGLINIDQGTGTPFTLKIKPRSVAEH